MKAHTQILIAILFLASNKMLSQVYKPIDTSATLSLKEFVDSYKIRHENKISYVKKEFSGDVKRKIESIYTEQFNEFVNGINKGELYFDKEINSYLQKILNHIVDSNPELNKFNFRIYFSREATPNAFSVGDGTLVIHLDLLNTIKTEGELASVISHEIAHYTLDHSGKSIKDYAEKTTSNEFKKEERSINYSKYNKQARAEKLVKFVVYSRKSKSRDVEFEADSKGYSYFKNTKYNQADFINALSKLQDADKEKDSLVNDDYKKIFNTKNQKFIEEWLFMEDFSKYKYSKKHVLNWEIDSLKTHPDCINRIEKIKKFSPKDVMSAYTVDEVLKAKTFEIAKMELIFNLYYFKEYGHSLYETLKLLKNDSQNPFLLKMMAKNVYKLATAKKKMKFNTYIPSVNPKIQTESQQRFYSFMNNITVSEFERLSNDFDELTK
jgi:hypothetical protein